MPTNLFLSLSDEKRNKIIEASIAEFARYGYYNSSTNRIIKASGISKGSLFKYFPSKEDLFFYILDMITSELMLNLRQRQNTLPPELFDRVIQYSKAEFTWYIQNPQKYQIILDSFTKSDTEIYYKTESRYHTLMDDLYSEALEGIDVTQLRWEKQKTADILKWLLKGFTTDFIAGMHQETDLNSIKHEYVRRLSEYMEILKTGILK